MEETYRQDYRNILPFYIKKREVETSSQDEGQEQPEPFNDDIIEEETWDMSEHQSSMNQAIQRGKRWCVSTISL